MKPKASLYFLQKEAAKKSVYPRNKVLVAKAMVLSLKLQKGFLFQRQCCAVNPDYSLNGLHLVIGFDEVMEFEVLETT